MNADESRIVEILDEIHPPVVVRFKWERVLSDASAQPLGHPRTRKLALPRLLAVTILVLLVVGTPVLAVGASRGWWFQAAHQPRWWASWPKPVTGAPAIIASGRAHGQPWTGVAFISRPAPASSRAAIRGNQICFAIILGSRSNPPQSSACGAVKLRTTPRGQTLPLLGVAHWSIAEPPVIAGAVTAAATRVQVVLNPNPYPNGRKQTLKPSLNATLLARVGVRLFVVSYPASVGIDYINVFDARGRLLEHRRFG